MAREKRTFGVNFPILETASDFFTHYISASNGSHSAFFMRIVCPCLHSGLFVVETLHHIALAALYKGSYSALFKRIRLRFGWNVVACVSLSRSDVFQTLM